MAAIRALFWDIGGVLLNNAWDHDERDVAIDHFSLDKPEFEARHKDLAAPFEEGKFTLDEYLKRSVFYKPRSFSSEEFTSFMFSLSQPRTEVIEIARTLARRYPMATINNESRELNQHRIRTFKLTELFSAFVSSCYVGIRKPDARIYKLALDLTQHAPEECCFIDDRPANVAGAVAVGMNAILMETAVQLRQDLQKLGVDG